MIHSPQIVPSVGIANSNTEPTESMEYSLVVVLPGGHTAQKTFYDRVRQQAMKVIPTLKRRRAYRSKEFCGVAFWATLDVGQQRLAGRCVAQMVATGHLPLVPIEGKPNEALWFRHK